MGFVMRLVFSAVDLSGVIISNLMGLGFATAYDPEGASQTPVVSEFFGVLALLTFLAINGHLMVIATLVQSFSALPIGNAGLSSGSWLNVANAGALIFSSGVFLALPVTVALLITNIALAILGRVAPQLNLMAIGFPITIVLGFATIAVSLSYLSAPLQKMFEFGLNSMLGYFAIGDNLIRTNPLYGRGCSFAAVTAYLLRDVLVSTDHAGDRLVEFQDLVTRELRPYYDNMRDQDRAAIRRASSQGALNRENGAGVPRPSLTAVSPTMPMPG